LLQAGTLAEAWNGSDVKNSINPTIKFGDGTTRRWIKFGTNCDLSDEKKWEPQLNVSLAGLGCVGQGLRFFVQVKYVEKMLILTTLFDPILTAPCRS
jgi:hypothetical protein